MTDSEAFARRTLLTMVAKAVQMQGNTTAAERRALDVMTDLVERYVEETGRLAALYRDLAGRSRGSFVDAYRALSDLGVTPTAEGVKGATVTGASGARRVRFPAPADVHLASTSLLDREDDKPAEPTPDIAPWLPPFPERHTYIFTDAPSSAPSAQVVQRVKTERKQQVETYLERLHDARASQPAPVTVDQEYADAHAAKRARVITVEEEEEVALIAERILTNARPPQ